MAPTIFVVSPAGIKYKTKGDNNINNNNNTNVIACATQVLTSARRLAHARFPRIDDPICFLWAQPSRRLASACEFIRRRSRCRELARSRELSLFRMSSRLICKHKSLTIVRC